MMQSTEKLSKELASYNIPTVTIEREYQYTCSVNTDNYMGAVQATSLLYKNNCDILFHINQNLLKSTPGYQRIQGFWISVRNMTCYTG